MGADFSVELVAAFFVVMAFSGINRRVLFVVFMVCGMIIV